MAEVVRLVAVPPCVTCCVSGTEVLAWKAVVPTYCAVIVWEPCVKFVFV